MPFLTGTPWIIFAYSWTSCKCTKSEIWHPQNTPAGSCGVLFGWQFFTPVTLYLALCHLVSTSLLALGKHVTVLGEVWNYFLQFTILDVMLPMVLLCQHTENSLLQLLLLCYFVRAWNSIPGHTPESSCINTHSLSLTVPHFPPRGQSAHFHLCTLMADWPVSCSVHSERHSGCRSRPLSISILVAFWEETHTGHK